MQTILCHKADYENLYAVCPFCQIENIFNRASDLKKFTGVDREIVQCEHCKKSFPIGNDTINEKYELFIFDCDELIKKKKYMHCIVSLCQACEAFFMKGIIIKLLFQPLRNDIFGKKGEIIIEKKSTLNRYGIFNRYSDKLHKAVKNYNYNPLRNTFFDLYLNDKTFISRKELDNYLQVIKSSAPTTPSDAEIKKKGSIKKRETFLKLKKLKVGEARNNVIHKDAYRPTKEEAEKYLKEVQWVIIGLKNILDFDDYYFPEK